MTFRCLLVAAAVAVVAVLPAAATPLDDYIALQDDVYNIESMAIERRGANWTAYLYNLTSQRWLTDADTSRSIWWHYLAVVVPDNVVANRTTAMLYLTGLDNDNGVPHADEEDLVVAGKLAVSSKIIVGVLFQVPNCPMRFPSDPLHEHHRNPNQIMAFTWWHVVQDPTSPYWAVLLPMTKAGVRAMDALQTVIPRHTNHSANITKFIVSGASKRGWTAWLVAAVDSRVSAVAPLVLDALNVIDFAHRQWRMYGAWTFALGDFWKMNITALWDSPGMLKLMQFQDPYYYLNRLTMPKFAVNAGGDEFQMPDDQRHWGHDTVGEMHYMLVKNADHTLATGLTEVLQGLGSWIQAQLADYPRPTYTWHYNETNGDITVVTDRPPKRVDITYADSAEGVSAGRRDFRWAALDTAWCPVKIFGGCIRPVLWATSPNDGLTQINATAWRAHMDAPSKGWRAFTIEMHWDNPTGPDDFYFTTPASVVPTTYPFADCHGEACKGKLC